MQTLIAHLDTSRNELLSELQDLSAAQWTSKPAEDRWSILEVLEHIATVEMGIFSLLSQKLFEAPATAEQKQQAAGKDAIIMDTMKDRVTRRVAPSFTAPKGRWASPSDALAAFDQTRSRIIQLLQQETRNLRDYCAPHPAFKTLDGYQWVLFMIVHSDRHREQIREIKAEARSQRTPPPPL